MSIIFYRTFLNIFQTLLKYHQGNYNVKRNGCQRSTLVYTFINVMYIVSRIRCVRCMIHKTRWLFVSANAVLGYFTSLERVVSLMMTEEELQYFVECVTYNRYINLPGKCILLVVNNDGITTSGICNTSNSTLISS
jgi:hypothetical protein